MNKKNRDPLMATRLLDSSDKDAKLSEREELLLMRYSDGECSKRESAQAERLVKRSDEARCFLEGLNELNSNFSILNSEFSNSAASQSSKVDLWDRIASRIREEERLELYLGERVIKSEEAEARQGLSAKIAAWLGLEAFSSRKISVLASSVAAAALLVVVMQQSPDSGDKTVANQGKQNSAEVNTTTLARANDVQQMGAPAKQLVSLEGGASASDEDPRLEEYEEPVILERFNKPSIEVDWVRSDGRVRMIHGKGAPVLWIKRRGPAQQEFLREKQNQTVEKIAPAIRPDKAVPTVRFVRD